MLERSSFKYRLLEEFFYVFKISFPSNFSSLSCLPQKYYNNKVTQNYLYFSFISDWDVPRPNPLSTLISARLEFKVRQNKLKHQINESESLREEITKLWKQLVDKQTSLKTLHLEFEKLVSFSNVVYLHITETGKIFILTVI